MRVTASEYSMPGACRPAAGPDHRPRSCPAWTSDDDRAPTPGRAVSPCCRRGARRASRRDPGCRPSRRPRREGRRARPPRSMPLAAWPSPPSGTLPCGVSMFTICGRNAASMGSSFPASMPEPVDSRWTVSGPSAWPSAAGSMGWLSPVPIHESTLSPRPASLSLPMRASMPPSCCTACCRPPRAAIGSVPPVAVPGHARHQLGQVVHRCSSQCGASGRASYADAGGRIRPPGRLLERPRPCPQALQQAAAGQVEVDRRDRDAPVDDRVEVRALHGQPRWRRTADPEVGDAALGSRRWMSSSW